MLHLLFSIHPHPYKLWRTHMWTQIQRYFPICWWLLEFAVEKRRVTCFFVIRLPFSGFILKQMYAISFFSASNSHVEDNGHAHKHKHSDVVWLCKFQAGECEVGLIFIYLYYTDIILQYVWYFQEGHSVVHSLFQFLCFVYNLHNMTVWIIWIRHVRRRWYWLPFVLFVITLNQPPYYYYYYYH